MIFVELLDRHGAVARRERLDRLPVRLGRGYDNDVIIDDPHVSPAHALIEAGSDGVLVLRDLGSVNGSREEVGSAPQAEVLLRPDLVLQLGRSRLRVRDASFAVDDAVPLRQRPRLLDWAINHWSAGVAWIAALVAVSAFIAVRATTAAIEWRSVGTDLLSLALGVLVWSGAWALVTRLLRGYARLVPHIAVACSVLLVSQGTELVFAMLQFLVAPVTPLQRSEELVTAILIAAVVLGHLRVLGSPGILGRRVAAACCGVAILAIGLGSSVEERADWTNQLPYWSRLEPIPASWLPTESPGEFFGGLGQLKEKLEASRSEPEPDG